MDSDIDQAQREKIRDALAERCNASPSAASTRRSVTPSPNTRPSVAVRKNTRASWRCEADPRPQLIAPLPDARLLPCMSGLNDVLGASKAIEPPASDVDGVVTQVASVACPTCTALHPGRRQSGRTDKLKIAGIRAGTTDFPTERSAARRTHRTPYRLYRCGWPLSSSRRTLRSSLPRPPRRRRSAASGVPDGRMALRCRNRAIPANAA